MFYGSSDSQPDMCRSQFEKATRGKRNHCQYSEQSCYSLFLFVFANIHKHRMCGRGFSTAKASRGKSSPFYGTLPRGFPPSAVRGSFLICNLRNEICFIHFTCASARGGWGVKGRWANRKCRFSVQKYRKKGSGKPPTTTTTPKLLKHIMGRWWLVREICATVCLAFILSEHGDEMRPPRADKIIIIHTRFTFVVRGKALGSLSWNCPMRAIVESCHKDNDDGWVVMELVGCCDDGDSAQWLIVMESHAHIHTHTESPLGLWFLFVIVGWPKWRRDSW